METLCDLVCDIADADRRSSSQDGRNHSQSPYHRSLLRKVTVKKYQHPRFAENEGHGPSAILPHFSRHLCSSLGDFLQLAPDRPSLPEEVAF